MLRLFCAFCLFAISSHASALTIKSGKTIGATQSSSDEVDAADIANADPQLVEAQLLLQRFSFIGKPPTGRWDNDYRKAAKQFYQRDFNKAYDGDYATTLLDDLRKRRLVMLPQQGNSTFAEETYDVSGLGIKAGFEAALDKDRFHFGELGFTALSSTEISPPFCYPTPQDCTDDKRIFSPNAHNAAIGDFNGDGHEDIAISWIYFTHTMPRSETPSHIRYYLNDGTGKLVSSPSIYKDDIMPLRHFMYRMAVADYNGDGVDDIFSGTMGVIKRIKDDGMISDFEPHVLLLSDGNGAVYDASHQIEGQEFGGLTHQAGFAHTSSVGDINCDGTPDIYAGGILLINDGTGHFSNQTDDLPQSVDITASPPKGASIIADYNGDGCGDLVTFDFNGNGHAWMSEDGRHDKRKVIQVPITHSYGAGNMQVNNAVAGDIDGDGTPEIIAAIHRKDPYYHGRRVTILKYNDRAFLDMDEKLIFDPRDKDGQDYLQAHGEGTVRVRDHDNDGDLDILDSHGGSYEENGRFGMSIFENDGTGHFTKIPQDEMVMLQEHMISGMKANRRTLAYGYPINLDDTGLLDYVSFTMMPWERDRAGWIGYTVMGK